MSLQTIYDSLQAALQGGTIALSSSTVPGIDLTLEAIGITPATTPSTLSVTSATLALESEAVVLSGTTSWRGIGWSAVLTGESLDPADPAANRFTLELQGIDGEHRWTFGTSFPNLPGSRAATESGTVPLGPSVIAPLVVETPGLSVTTQPPRPARPFVPSLEGWLVLRPSALERYADYFGDDRLRLGGTIDFLDPANPVIAAKAAAPAGQRDLPVIPISEVGVRLQSNAPDAFSLEDGAVASVAAAYADLRVCQLPRVDAEVAAPLLQGDFIWPMTAEFSQPFTASTGLAMVLEFFGQPPQERDLFSLPIAGDLFRNFGLTGVEVGVRPPIDGQALQLVHASMVFRSNQDWTPSIAFVKVQELGAGWTYHWSGDAPVVTGNAWGRIVFFDDPALQVPPLGDACTSNRIVLYVEAGIPDFQIQGATEGDICVPVGRVLKSYLGGSGGLSDDLRIRRIAFNAVPKEQSYQASMMVDGIWAVRINRVEFSLDRIIAELMVTQSRVYGNLTGWTSIAVSDGGVETTKATFVASADYRQDGTWHFEGGLAKGTLDVVDFAFGLLGWRPSVALPEIDLTELWLEYTTALEGSANPYSARGKLVTRWKPEVLGMKLSIEAEARVARRAKESSGDRARALAAPRLADAEMIYEGALSGTLRINSFAVTVGLSFVDQETVYLFELALGDAKVRAATEWVEDRALPAATGEVPQADVPGKHQILVVTLSGFTLGDMVTSLVHLANPNANYQLDAPWSFLNAIDLSRFTLRLDPKYQEVSLTYRVDLSLPFIQLDSVGLVYDRSTGEGTVRFVLEGKFLGKSYSLADGNPLSWDAVNDPPPQVPGEGPQLFDLRYLGMGQHVALRNPHRVDSITDVLRELEAEMRPPSSMEKNPFAESAIVFDPDSQWMFGIDCTVMDTVSLGIVLHDPDLYGLVVALGGPEAGSLAGLRFELLYQKITDSVGVFRVRLQVPEAFRQLDFGYFAITLGVITVDIFTNGNFKVDLGFPHGGDFSNSFGLQVTPFIGSGGLYFGLLDGTTSTRVPAITNGTFDPVLELGVGLAVGVGRTFNLGPLRAGLYVEMLAILEGVLGWFHPTDASASKAMYYWVQGSAGLVGKLYGSVDFVVIKVGVSVEAHATVSVTLAAYRATEVELSVGVDVEAEVDILFFSVSFTFSIDLTASFTIGGDSPTPWILADDQSGRSPARLLANVATPRRRRPRHVAALTRQQHLRARLGGNALRARQAGAPIGYDLHWPDAAVFPDGAVHPVSIAMLPCYAVDGVPVQWPSQPAPQNPDPAYQIAFLLAVETGVSPDARTAAEARRLSAERSATGASAEALSFSQIVEGMFRWSLAALGLDPVAGDVTPGQLEELAAQLDLPRAASDLDMALLSRFFQKNLTFRVSGIPSGGNPARVGGSAFPMPPPLAWETSRGASDARHFASYQPIDATYAAGVRAYFAELDPAPEAPERAALAVQAAQSTAQADGAAESMATFLFRDYFLLVAKAAVQAAQQLVASFPYQPTGAAAESLSWIAGRFPTVTDAYVKQAGDTLDQVAEHYGYSSSELSALDPGLQTALDAAAPGETVPVLLGVTPESLVAANPGWALATGVALELGELIHPIGEGETIASMAARYGADADTWLSQLALRAQRDLLAVGSPLAIPQSGFTNSGGRELGLVAALLFVRLRGTVEPGLVAGDGVPLVEWYAQAIGGLNTIVDGQLPEVVRVPRAYDDLTSPPVEWTRQPGDTLWRVAATFAIYQNQAGDPAFAPWLEQVVALNPGAGPFARVVLPATSTVVLPGENLEELSARLPIVLPNEETWLDPAASFRALVGSAAILRPLATVAIPGCRTTTVAGQTLGGLASTYDLALEELGRRVAGVGGLLASSTAPTFVVPHPPAVPIGGTSATEADLVPALLRDQASTIAGQASRFLVSGLRMPAPEAEGGTYRPTGPMTGLFALSGQQLPGPSRPPVCPPPTPATSLTVTVRNEDPTATWLQVFDATTLEASAALTPALERHNPGLARRNATAGLVALTAPVESLVFDIRDADLCAYYPAAVLQQTFIAAPGARAIHRDVLVRHALQQQIRWQTTEALGLPNPSGASPPANGAPSLWPFSSELQAAAERQAGKAFQLQVVDPQLGPNAAPRELGFYAWAVALDVRIRNLPGLRGCYEVFGADTTTRQMLLELWQYLAAGTDSAVLHLAYQSSPGGAPGSGLCSVPVGDAATYLVKTNLSTDTQSGMAAAARDALPTWGPYYARLADAPQFLQLLWECSVVGGSGYWLHYAAGDGAPLPEEIFSSDGVATLTLVATLASQLAAAPDRALHRFNNVVLLGEPLDPSASNVFAQVRDGSETRREATVSPGNVAFGATLARPPANTWPQVDPAIAIRQLYGQLAYQLAENQTFASSHPSMPIGPSAPRSADGSPSSETWDLFQVLPIARYARSHPLPAVDGLPKPGEDPYAGVHGAAQDGTAAPGSASVALWFQDVLGNASASAGGPGEGGPAVIDLPVGYTDPVIGVGTWPSTTSSYRVLPATSGATLRVELAMQAASYLAGGRQRGSEAAQSAKDQLPRFEALWYQLMQPDVTTRLLTTLEVAAGQPVALPAAGSLGSFAASACAWLGLTGSLADILADPSLTPTLADVSSRHGVGYDGLAAVNGEVALSELFPDPTAAGAGPAFSIPVYATFREGDSVAELCAGRAGVDPVEVLQDPENESLPLRDGIELRIPVRTWTMPADPAPPAAPLTLAAIADANRLTPASMVRANAATTGLLRPGFVFTCDGVEVVVTAEHPDVSLDEVAATFTDHGVPCDAVMAGVGNGEAPGMFRPLAVLSIDRYLIAQGDTLAANGSGATTAELASRNTATEDLYFAGTAVYLKSTSAGAAFQLTLAGAAGQLGLPADQLLRHNRAVPLRRGQDVPSALALPGQAALPATIRQLRMGWAIPAGSTLAGVAALFVNADPSQSSAALALAQANLAMPGVVAGGQTVQVAGQTVTTQAGDSFAAVLARFQPPVALAGLVAAVQDTPGILATGAILLTPPAQLPSTPAVWKPAEVAARYGVTVGDLAAANAALANLVVPGVTLTAPLGSDGSVTITTGAGDSFVSFSWRFAQVGQEVAPSAALEANADVPFLAGGAILLLAPPPAVLTATLGAQGWRFPAAVIQLQVWVEIARAPSLVDPEFRGEGDAGPAVRDRTLVPPMVRAGAGSTGDQVLALEPFAAELEAAIPALRVATGQPVTDGGIDRAAGQADVWAVAFGAGWLASVDVHPGVTVGSATIPQFFALRPLSPALVARAGVGIRPIQPDGTLGDPVATDFQGIDLEVWAGRVLSDIDLFLSARYAPAAYQTPARQVLEQVLDAKKALAAAIVQGLDYVLELGQEDPSRQNPPPPDWASAGEALRQRLLVSLSAGCAVDGVVQYQAQVQSPWSQEVARLSGAARVSPSSDTQGDEARRTSLGNAKTSLATTQAGAPGYVDFLLDVAQEGVGRTADLSLGYAVNELEFGIREVVEGYDASSWLAFVRPFGENLPPGVVFTLGEVSIPVPVRGYPALPALVSQVSQPTHQTPAGWQEAFHWDYACSYQHQSAAADQIAIEVDFNQTPLMAPAASAAPDTLFDALAQYQSMAAGVWLLLEQLATWDQASSAQQTAIVNAMQTFGQVVGAVAAGWSAHWTRGATARVRRASANGPQPERYSFMQTLDSAWDAALQKTCYTAIYLQRTEATGGLGWPQMGIAIDGAVVSLGQGTDTPRGRKYDLPAGVEAYVLRTFELRFTELHVASYQNGSARVQVVRNAQLSPLAPTRSSFVSRTPWSAFPDVVEPFLSYGEPFPIGTWTWTAADNPLGPVFDQMFAGSPANRTLSCQIRYGYELARSGEEAIVPFLPVAFRPKFSYVPGTSAGTLPEIIATVRAWNERERPATTGAEWSFALELYASVEGRLERPLLQLPVYAVAGGSGD